MNNFWRFFPKMSKTLILGEVTERENERKYEPFFPFCKGPVSIEPKARKK